ncbi:sodium/potassium-transporting ATPase subunit beta-3b [Solea solea]|uniref:sodium/potassium-transporting ATPase subunit beta-3b n=1 Tax=Solea solea TaxID=90069 RepID=UPI00272CFDA6|nr:sodium/potassium-transporting ATPase subunit beta-3b [Solea solea]
MSSSPEHQNQEPKEDGKEERNEERKEDVKETEVKNVEMKEEPEQDKKDGKKEETKEMKETKESFMDSIYNTRSGEFLGRTARSWGLILLFYLVFYAFLAGLFLLTMWVMLQTLDENVPRYQERVANPGLVICPHAEEISFNHSEPASYTQYIQQMNHLLQQYNDSVQAQNDLCLVGQFTEQDDEPTKKVCQFKRSILQQCSGLHDASFGFAEGKPCVIVKMNRVIGLKPRGNPYINCTAKRDSPLHMQYFPTEGLLDKMYFPYYGKKAHPDYVQPLVAVKLFLTKEDFNVEQAIECRVEGSEDLRNDDSRDKFQGRVSFRVKVSE